MANYLVIAEVNTNIVHGYTAPPRIKCEQYDGDYTRLIHATLYNGDQKYTIPSEVRRITVSGIKPDGTGFSYDCTWSGSVVSLSLMRQMTVVYGEVPCNITLLNSAGNQLSTAVIVLDVERAALQDTVLESSNDFQTIIDYLQASELYAQYSKSYAVGHTGVRTDENVDNSEYYAYLARMYKGSPLIAETAAKMTDKTRVYVYVGNEAGYTNGNWYYWNDSAWVSGGVYNAQGVQTDKLLITPDIAADAEAVGKRILWFVTPQMFGAKGDGIANDRAAFQAAVDSGAERIIIPKGNYLIDGNINLSPYSTFTGASKGDSILINACIKVNYHCTVSDLTLEYTNTLISVGVLVSSEYMGDAKLRNNVAVLIQNIVVNPYAVRTSISNKTYDFTAFELESGSTGSTYYGYWGVIIKDIYIEPYVTTALKIHLNYRANYMAPWITCCYFENWQINGCIYAIVADYWTDGTTLDASQMISPMGTMQFVGFITQHVDGLSENYYYSKIAGTVRFSRSSVIDYVSGEGTAKAFRFTALGFYKWINSVIVDETCGLNNSASEVYIDNITNGHDRDVYDIFGRVRNVRLTRYLNALYPEGIPANSDLNDYTTPGTYYCASSSIGTIANTPITDSAISVTNTVITNGRLKQIVTSDLGDLTYMRTLKLGNNVWNPFVKMPTRQELSDMLPNGKLAFSASANATINIPNASSGLLIITSSTFAIAGMLMYYSTGSGAVTVTDISIKGFTYTVSSGTITLNANSGTPSWVVGYMQTRGKNVPTT